MVIFTAGPIVFITAILIALPPLLCGAVPDQPAGAADESTTPPATQSTAYSAAGAVPGRSPEPSTLDRENYVLGPDDEVLIWALGVDELEKATGIVDQAGFIDLPLVGRVKAIGRTPEELKEELRQKLTPFVREPDVTVTVKELRSMPVSVIGEVKTAGIHQLKGRKTLMEVLSLAGGLSPVAGHTIIITRRMEFGLLPLAGATRGPSGRYSIGRVNLESVLQSRNPEQNVVIMPHDTISVPRAQMVYVVGRVKKAGGFVLHERETISVLQALSLAEGLDHTAAPSNALIVRNASDLGARQQTRVDIKKILAGKSEDVPLRPEDILFVPTSAAKNAGLRAAEAAIQMATGVVIWRR